MHKRVLLAVPFVMFAALFVGVVRGDDETHRPAKRSGNRTAAVTPSADSTVRRGDSRSYVDVVSEAGQAASGIYITGPYVRHEGHRGVLRAAQRARATAVVIDVKDGQGRVTYDTRIPILQAQKRPMLGDARALVRLLKQNGIYTIARVVCFSDPQLPRMHPERAIIDNRPSRHGQPWVSWGTAGTWLDPYNEQNHDMIVELTREAAALGFDEVQLDYIRWPVDPGIPYAQYPALRTTPRYQVLLGLLRRIDANIQVPLSVDVFGLTAFRPGDSDGLGQDLEAWKAHVEVYTPMLYMNSMRNWSRGLDQRAMQLVYTGVQKLRARVGPEPVIRPFLQAFAKGADYYNGAFIAEQIRGARNGGADGFLFWHPGSNYGTLFSGMRGPARGLVPFPIAGRAAERQRSWNRASASR